MPTLVNVDAAELQLGFERRDGRRPVGGVLALATAAIVCVAVSGLDVFRLARLFELNSDMVTSFLAAQSILHGNILLHGWLLAANNYYFDQKLPFAAVEAVFGSRVSELTALSVALHVLIMGASLLAVLKRRNPLRTNMLGLAMIVLLLGAPPAATPLPMIDPDSHGSGIIVSLLALLLLARLAGAGRCSRASWAVFAVLSCCIVASDPLTVVYAFGPAALAFGVSSLTGPRPRRAAFLAGIVAACVLAGLAVPHVIAWFGGFRVGGVIPLAFVDGSHLARTFQGVLFGFLRETGANFFGKEVASWATVARGLRLAAWVVGAIAVARRARLPGAVGSLDRLLLAGTASLTLACLTSRVFDNTLTANPAENPGTAGHYLSPLVVFGAIVLARATPEAIGRLATRRLRLAASFSLIAGAAGLLVLQTADTASLSGSPAWIKANRFRDISRYLEAKGLVCGVGDYWDAPLISVLSQGRIEIRAVAAAPHGSVAFFPWLSDAGQYSGMTRPMFAVWRIGKPNWLNVGADTVTAAFGKPDRVEEGFGYKIAYIPNAKCR